MRRKTREQIKRERIKTAVLAVVLIAAWTALAAWMFVTWVEHPAERPVNGAEYRTYVQTLNGGGN